MAKSGKTHYELGGGIKQKTMKQFSVLILATVISACSSQKIKQQKPKKSKFEIIQVMYIQKTDTLYGNKLRFNYVSSSLNTKQVMYDKFGMWDEEIRPNNENHPILVWRNRKLYKNIDDNFTIAVSGLENRNGMYALVAAFDSKNRDCLSQSSKKRNLIIDFFAYRLKYLNDKSNFYKVYWKMINNYKTKNLENK